MTGPDEHGLSYVYIGAGRPVAYSVEMAPDVIADFDELGELAGVEFLTVEALARADEIVARAPHRSRGPKARITPDADLHQRVA